MAILVDPDLKVTLEHLVTLELLARMDILVHPVRYPVLLDPKDLLVPLATMALQEKMVSLAALVIQARTDFPALPDTQVHF